MTDGVRAQIGYVGIGAVVAAVIYSTLFLGTGPSEVIHGEDKLIEYIGALALVVGGVTFLACFLRVRKDASYTLVKRASFLLLAVAFFFGAGEEISWGQRIFGVETPEAIAENNAQGELNFHNLDFLGALDFENIFQLFWLGFGVLIPVVATASKRARNLIDPLIPILPVWLSVLFLIQQAIGEVVQSYLESHPDQFHAEAAAPLVQVRFEATETILSLLLAVGALFVYRQVKARSGEPATPGGAPSATETTAAGS